MHQGAGKKSLLTLSLAALSQLAQSFFEEQLQRTCMYVDLHHEIRYVSDSKLHGSRTRPMEQIPHSGLQSKTRCCTLDQRTELDHALWRTQRYQNHVCCPEHRVKAYAVVLIIQNRYRCCGRSGERASWSKIQEGSKSNSKSINQFSSRRKQYVEDLVKFNLQQQPTRRAGKLVFISIVDPLEETLGRWSTYSPCGVATWKRTLQLSGLFFIEPERWYTQSGRWFSTCKPFSGGSSLILTRRHPGEWAVPTKLFCPNCTVKYI